jgi:uncharacterized protein (TIGR02611 family)
VHSLSELLRWIWRSTKRIVVFVVGVALVVLGLVLLVLPGPGILVVFLGVAILATEFAWAEVALDKAKAGAASAGQAAKRGFGRLTGRGGSDDATEGTG